jgi:hypothetical protein
MDPPGRPVDPDPTGGYYQPVELIAPSPRGPVLGIEEARIGCGLPLGASPDVAAAFASRYHVNANPAIASLTSLDAKGHVMDTFQTDDKGASNTVARGAKLSLRAAWQACPTTDTCGDGQCGPDETATTCAVDCMTPAACTGAERFAEMQLSTLSVQGLRESIAVAWFATGGSFDSDRTGRDSGDLTTRTDNGWRAPNTTGTIHMWIVIRDSRGGTGWSEYAFDVR